MGEKTKRQSVSAFCENLAQKPSGFPPVHQMSDHSRRESPSSSQFCVFRICCTVPGNFGVPARGVPKMSALRSLFLRAPEPVLGADLIERRANRGANEKESANKETLLTACGSELGALESPNNDGAPNATYGEGNGGAPSFSLESELVRRYRRGSDPGLVSQAEMSHRGRKHVSTRDSPYFFQIELCQ